MIATQTDADLIVSADANTGRKALLLGDGQRLYPLFLTVSRASTTVKVPVRIGEVEVRIPEDWNDCSAEFQDWLADYLGFVEGLVEQHQLGVDETKRLFTLRLKRLIANYKLAPPHPLRVPVVDDTDPTPISEPEPEPEQEAELEPEYEEILSPFVAPIGPPQENLILQRVVLKKQAGIHLLDPEEAAAVLGIPINGRVNVKMAWLISHGFIERFSRNGQKTYFWRADLDQLAVSIANGKVNIPTS